MIQSTNCLILMRSGGPLVDVQFGGLRLLLMFNVVAYSNTNRMALEVLLERT